MSDTIAFTLNGTAVEVSGHPMRRLIDVLREDLGLTGTKEGCGEGECGACTVIVNGEMLCSCLVPVAQVSRANVLTIEGLSGAHPLQRAFAEHGGAQCGICTPGMIMAALTLGPTTALQKIRVGLAGNLCRCTGYEAIYRSVIAAGKEAWPSDVALREDAKRTTEGPALQHSDENAGSPLRSGRQS